MVNIMNEQQSLISHVPVMVDGAFYNVALAIIGFLIFRFMLRFVNKRNGYTLDQFFRDCRNEKQFNAIAIVFGLYAMAAAILVGGIIS